MSDYTITNLEQCEDIAAGHGVGDAGVIHFPREAVEAERTGFAHLRLRPGKRHPFPHRHEQAEEVYLVLAGSGRVKLDDELRELVKAKAPAKAYREIYLRRRLPSLRRAGFLKIQAGVTTVEEVLRVT